MFGGLRRSTGDCPPHPNRRTSEKQSTDRFGARLPNKPRGIPRVDDRRVLNGIFWVLRSGAPWRDLPKSYGPHTTCYNRFANALWTMAVVDGHRHLRRRGFCGPARKTFFSRTIPDEIRQSHMQEMARRSYRSTPVVEFFQRRSLTARSRTEAQSDPLGLQLAPRRSSTLCPRSHRACPLSSRRAILD
jgi:transposase